jgi:hypothetical protein
VTIEGFHDIGYHFLIDAGGTVYEGRFSRPYAPGETPTGQNLPGLGVVGAQVANRNVGSVGVGLLGDFGGASPTGPALTALIGLLAWLADQYGLDPGGSTGGGPVIAGHRDANQTSCPGEASTASSPASARRWPRGSPLAAGPALLLRRRARASSRPAPRARPPRRSWAR